MGALLVTGGCGFIGSNFIRHLLATDSAVHVINFDALTYAGNLQNLAGVDKNPRYTFIRGDVADRDAVRAVMQRSVSDVIHFAAESHVDRSIQDSGPFEVVSGHGEGRGREGKRAGHGADRPSPGPGSPLGVPPGTL